jgi:hypothetical protein
MATTTEAKKISRKRAGNRPAKRSAAASRRSSRSDEGTALHEYGDSAARFIATSQRALGQIYGWADKKGRQIPGAIKGVHLPDTKSLQSFAEDRSLVLGAVGLGLGVLIGALLPTAGVHGSTTRRQRKAGPSRRYH